jgi:hypothetical protein
MFPEQLLPLANLIFDCMPNYLAFYNSSGFLSSAGSSFYISSSFSLPPHSPTPAHPFPLCYVLASKWPSSALTQCYDEDYL